MVKRFVILPSDRTWLDIARHMQEKGMPVLVDGDDYAITAWHRGWSQNGVTVMEFAEPGDVATLDFVRPDADTADGRKHQRDAEHAEFMDRLVFERN